MLQLQLGDDLLDARELDDQSFLEGRRRPRNRLSESGSISVVDAFAGCGGLAVGAIEGARRSGRPAGIALAMDIDPEPLSVLGQSVLGAEDRTLVADLGTILGSVAEPPRESEQAIQKMAAGASILVAGPPCQGHSALNNHTRHDDPRNDLYLAVARLARLIAPRAVIIENVSGVGSDRRKSVTRCAAALEELGYQVSSNRLDLTAVGVPQRRRRHVLVATRGSKFDWTSTPTGTAAPRSVRWAIGDLGRAPKASPFTTASSLSVENERRVRWLFDHGAYDLPNHMRPRCHQSDHSYRSMYGRLSWDKPSQTITSGFGSMGQGRFVHPSKPRTLTPQEAARLQFLPSSMRLETVQRRSALAKMIGNAAPPALTAWLVEELDRQGLV